MKRDKWSRLFPRTILPNIAQLVQTIKDVKNVGDVIFDDVVDQDPIVSVRMVRQHSFVQNLQQKYSMFNYCLLSNFIEIFSIF